MNDDLVRLGERVRDAVLQAGLAAFEDAAMQGLCCDGAWEVAVSAMRRVDVEEVLAASGTPTDRPA